MKVRNLLMALVALGLLASGMVQAQEASGRSPAAYPEAEASSGYFRDTEPLFPGAYQIYLQTPQSLGGFWGIGPRPVNVDRKSFAKDAHANVRGYSVQRKCVSCHEGLNRNLHSARTTVTCRQCHRDEPMAGIFHYYSAMNPIRRHAYVCAKCHEGATANFAAYVVHEPAPLAEGTAESFPALYYVSWVMVVLAGGVFVFFIPYVLLWGLRELIIKFKKGVAT